ncbi:MAG: MATE family efflux transporter [Sulfolobales archaeon]|nr:MATE family efflux transporter [Sulfolobales archaeon]
MDEKDWVLKTSIVRAMIKLGLPLGLMQALHIAYNITDMFWLGRLGRDSLAAVNATWPVVFLIVSGLVGFLQAGISLVSQYWGAKEYSSAMNAVGQVFLIIVITGLPISLVAYTALPSVFEALGVPDEVITGAVIYGRIFSLGMVIFGVMDATVSIFSAVGDTLTPLKVRTAGVLINVALDPILIFGLGPIPPLGIAGAAIATLVSDLIASLISIRILTTGIRGEKLTATNLRPNKELLTKLVKIGLPISISSIGEAGGFTLLTAIISMLGTAALAAWGIGDRPLGLLDIFVGSLLTATTTIVGQSLGAGMLERAKQTAIKSLIYSSLITAVGVCCYVIFRYEVVTLFSPSDTEVIQNAADFLLLMGPSIVFFVMLRAAFSIASASGHTKIVMILSLLRLWVLRNALAYLFGPGPLGMGVRGLWVGMAISNVVTGTLALAWILKGGWLKPIISDTSDSYTR